MALHPIAQRPRAGDLEFASENSARPGSPRTGLRSWGGAWDAEPKDLRWFLNKFRGHPFKYLYGFRARRLALFTERADDHLQQMLNTQTASEVSRRACGVPEIPVSVPKKPRPIPRSRSRALAAAQSSSAGARSFSTTPHCFSSEGLRFAAAIGDPSGWR